MIRVCSDATLLVARLCARGHHGAHVRSPRRRVRCRQAQTGLHPHRNQERRQATHVDTDRKRHLWPDRGPRRQALGRPDPAFAAQLRHLGRKAAQGNHPRPGAGQACVGQGQRGPGSAGREKDQRHHRCRRRSAGRQASGRISAGGLADRLGHPDQHERQRGAGQPRQRTAGRPARGRASCPPQRRRQPQPVQQRRVSHGPCMSRRSKP